MGKRDGGGRLGAEDGTPVVAFEDVSKIYSSGEGWRTVLKGVWLEVMPGRTVSVVGRSGSGKTTLLNLAAGIDTATRGRVSVDGQDLAGLSDRARTLLRRNTIGMVFQFFHLLSHLSVQENVVLPELIAGGDPQQFKQRAENLLQRVGLDDRSRDNIQKLSGGEMQRVAICRALLRSPRLILADEPTGNLDDDTSQSVMQLMLQLVEEEGSSLIYVTHSRTLADLADESYTIHSGILDAGSPRQDAKGAKL